MLSVNGFQSLSRIVAADVVVLVVDSIKLIVFFGKVLIVAAACISVVAVIVAVAVDDVGVIVRVGGGFVAIILHVNPRIRLQDLPQDLRMELLGDGWLQFQQVLHARVDGDLQQRQCLVLLRTIHKGNEILHVHVLVVERFHHLPKTRHVQVLGQAVQRGCRFGGESAGERIFRGVQKVQQRRKDVGAIWFEGDAGCAGVIFLGGELELGSKVLGMPRSNGQHAAMDMVSVDQWRDLCR
mmetsp:Transcript_20577/g.58489  ORF Transcript_20577/g.58489 Transcript_20577/m.58489 type:complete len:239 (-) Transcript_20577:364-1080(-)